MMHPGSLWTGSQLAVTLQAVSGPVNGDMACTAQIAGAHCQLAVFPKKENITIW